MLQHQPGRRDIKRYPEFLRVARDGLVAFQLPHKLPLRTSLMPRRKPYLLLRGLGFGSRFLYWRLGLHPMRATSVATSEVAGFLASRGARVLDLEQREGEMGCQDSIYFVARAGARASDSGRFLASTPTPG